EAFPVPLLRLLLGWLAATADGAPARRAELEQDACWLVVGFFGMLRRSELAGLRLGDVHSLTGGVHVVRITRSKTDQVGAGVDVHLGASSGSGVRIGRIIGRHLERARSGGAEPSAPLFTRGPQWGPGSEAWRKEGFTRRLRALLGEMQRALPQIAGRVPDYASHSLRRGGATAAAEGGASGEQIKAHGRWRSEAVSAYILPSAAAKARIVGCM
ncbi:hypothetical protein Agub_g11378, partial [Astrephomene gubernaculifera]